MSPKGRSTRADGRRLRCAIRRLILFFLSAVATLVVSLCLFLDCKHAS